MRNLITIFILSFTISPALAQCPAELAIYKHNESKDFSITFSKQKDPKAWSNLQATMKTPSRHFDFEFTASNGYSINYMVILTKGIKIEQDLPVLFLDHKLKSLDLPQAGNPAPEFIIASELGPWLYYAGFKKQEFIPTGIWKLGGCQK